MKTREGHAEGSHGQALTIKGEMAELIRAFDWSRTPIGPQEQWSASFRTIVDVLLATQFPVALLWGRELILIYNDAYRVICGDKHPAALGRSTREIWSEVWHINQPIFAAVMDRGETLWFEDRLFPINRCGHLEDAYFTLCYSPVRKDDGSIGGVLVILEETTDRIKSVKALERTSDILAEAQRIAHVGSFEYVAATQTTVWSEEEHRIYGLDPAGPSPTYDEMLRKCIHPDDAGLLHGTFTKAIQSGSVYELEHRIVRPDGSVRWVYDRAQPYFDADGKLARYIGTTLDITERKRAAVELELHREHLAELVLKRTKALEDEITERRQVEAELRESEERFQLFMDNSPTIAWIKDEQGRHVYLSKTFEDRFSVRLADWRGKTDAALWPAETAEIFRRNDRDVLEAGHAIEVEEETINPDGSHSYWLNCKFPFSDATGNRYVAGIGMDITLHKRAEALLQQAQKLEIIGRLAGGMAHEFNNILQGIVGYTELCRTQIAPDHPVGAHLNEIDVSAMRAVNLVRQLLAFARKQIVLPDVFDLNEHVPAFLTLLRRLIRDDIGLIWMPGTSPLIVKMDPLQVDQILTNLAANASDAIHGPGKITITTSASILDASSCATHTDATPGHYAMLAFSDTGCGIDEATRSHMFEPFFTTKEVGKGTGMGLASVHGIVKQNNGYVTVESQPGEGTTLRIYLPLFFPLSSDPAGTPAP